MYGFIIKKNFCDGWDNLLSVIITNIIFLFSALGIVCLSAFFSSKFMESMPELLFYGIQTVIILIGVIILSIIAFAYGEQAAKIADFRGCRTRIDD